MKRLHRPDLHGWSHFNNDRNLDFHSVLWVREGGNVAVDPLPLSDHDRAHLEKLGSVATIVITNSDHVRAAAQLAADTGAALCGPAGEREGFPLECSRWLGDGDEVVPGLRALALDGSKTPGELALLLEETTLITGDLVRAHEAGRLCMLPDPKLRDRAGALASVRRLAALPGITAVLPGDGWPIFRDGAAALGELARSGVHDGGCLCQAVRFRATGAPKWTAYCHCHSCRKHTGAPVSAYAGFRSEQVAFTSGEPTYHASSSGVRRGFCATCGATLTFEGERWPGELHVHVGALDDPESFAPTVEAFSDERVSWLDLHLAKKS